MKDILEEEASDNAIKVVEFFWNLGEKFYVINKEKWVELRKTEYWVPYLFYIMEGGLQRIQLETTECTNCNWRGTIGNPTLPDLYIALKDRVEIMRKCAQLKQVTCPICNGKLKRDAIWVES